MSGCSAPLRTYVAGQLSENAVLSPFSFFRLVDILSAGLALVMRGVLQSGFLFLSLVLILVAARPKPTSSLTNGERFRRGLPPKAPAKLYRESARQSSFDPPGPHISRQDPQNASQRMTPSHLHRCRSNHHLSPRSAHITTPL